MEKSAIVISEAAKSHGFEVEETAEGLVMGKWNGEEAAIFIYSGEEDREDLFLFLDAGVSHRAVALMAPVDEGIMSACQRENVQVWQRENVEALVGRHTLLVKAGVKLREPLFSKREEPVEIFSSTMDLKSEQVLVPTVSRAEVEHRCSRIGGFKFHLILVPHHLFKYRCILESTDGRQKEKQGLVWVDSMEGNCRDMVVRFEAVDDLEQPHFKQEPDISLAEATELALQGITTLNTREAEEVRHTGSATIFEKHKISPLHDSIETEYMGIIYVPMWQVEGSRGTIFLNGITAEILREDSYQE